MPPFPLWLAYCRPTESGRHTARAGMRGGPLLSGMEGRARAKLRERTRELDDLKSRF